MLLWGGGAKTHIRKAQVILNAAARWATGLGKRTRVLTLMERTGLLTIKEQTRLSTAVLTWKIVYLDRPARTASKIQVTVDLKIQVERPRLQITPACFRWWADREWNELSTDLRHVANVSNFQKADEDMDYSSEKETTWWLWWQSQPNTPWHLDADTLLTPGCWPLISSLFMLMN